MILTFAGQKGGTGKTTLATNVAGMLAAQGRRILLIDADPQRSAQQWMTSRPASLAQVGFEAVAGTPEAIRAACHAPAAQDADIVILDTGGRISPGVREAICRTDFLIIPVLPSLPDVRSTEAFYDKVLNDVARHRPLRGALVMNGMQRGVALCDEAYAYVRDETQLPLFDAVVHQYVAFRRAIGQGMTVAELEPSGRAAADMLTLLKELKEELKL